ncbi:efflux RND transporter periplasmic adaptor subunit [Aquibacillus halophilus]|uniref:Efflux RND transporter periplasmic adaptor subunit n=1 Tax=Aquibacillus halophilus TaxID=930132 RepID=A0A6A8DJL9_9BACI|nr:efflux RND transporter periplasmic adaptor subunit [Aquibacillus halophilus]MRH43939.1 efflux RND transporter periplasmic adaptor subunit [Aquibacillus halophilus]
MKKFLFPLFALMLILVGCSEDDTTTEEQEDRVTPVEVDQVIQEDLIVEKKFYGRTMPESSTPVIAPVAGEIETLEVAKGDQIDEEDIIATITRADGRGELDIEAPASGQLTTLDAKEGGMISNTEPFAVIVNLDTIQIQLNVTAENLDIFDGNDQATVRFDTIDLEEAATIDYVSSVANETGLYTIELSVDNQANNIKPGMVAVVHLPENVVESALQIPTTALVEEADETYVYVIEDDEAKKVAVTVIEAQTDWTAIEGEINKGDTVVTSGQLTLADGYKVDIMKEEG